MNVRTSLTVIVLLPLSAIAQPTTEQVQTELDNLFARGRKRPSIEYVEEFNDRWLKSVNRKVVECRGDRCTVERYGLINREKGDTLAAEFDEIRQFNDHIFLSWDNWACLTDANLKVTNAYPRAQLLSRHFIAASNGTHYGVIDTVLNQIIPPRYDSIRQVVDLWLPHDDTTPDFIVKESGKWGVVNYKNGVKIKFAFETLVELDGFAGFAGKKGKYGFVRWDGVPVTQFVYDSMYTDWSSPNFIITRNNEIGLMDDVGKELVSPTLSEVTRASTYGCRCARRDDKYAVLSSRGVNLSGFVYDDFKEYPHMHDEMLLRRDGKWGFFGCRSKKEISPFIYDAVVAFYGDEVDMMLNGVKKKIKLRDE